MQPQMLHMPTSCSGEQKASVGWFKRRGLRVVCGGRTVAAGTDEAKIAWRLVGACRNASGSSMVARSAEKLGPAETLPVTAPAPPSSIASAAVGAGFGGAGLGGFRSGRPAGKKHRRMRRGSSLRHRVAACVCGWLWEFLVQRQDNETNSLRTEVPRHHFPRVELPAIAP